MQCLQKVIFVSFGKVRVRLVAVRLESTLTLHETDVEQQGEGDIASSEQVSCPNSWPQLVIELLSVLTSCSRMAGTPTWHTAVGYSRIFGYSTFNVPSGCPASASQSSWVGAVSYLKDAVADESCHWSSVLLTPRCPGSYALPSVPMPLHLPAVVRPGSEFVCNVTISGVASDTSHLQRVFLPRALNLQNSHHFSKQQNTNTGNVTQFRQTSRVNSLLLSNAGQRKLSFRKQQV